MSEQPPILFLGEWIRGACCAQRLARDAFTMENGKKALATRGHCGWLPAVQRGMYSTCKQVEVSVDRRPGEHMAIAHGPSKKLASDPAHWGEGEQLEPVCARAAERVMGCGHGKVGSWELISWAGAGWARCAVLGHTRLALLLGNWGGARRRCWSGTVWARWKFFTVQAPRENGRAGACRRKQSKPPRCVCGCVFRPGGGRGNRVVVDGRRAGVAGR